MSLPKASSRSEAALYLGGQMSLPSDPRSTPDEHFRATQLAVYDEAHHMQHVGLQMQLQNDGVGAAPVHGGHVVHTSG